MVSKITTPPSQVDLVDKVNEIIDDKQDTLVSGTNIKTINNTSILGSGNISITSQTSWGSITGTLSDQTDLKNALDAKYDASNPNGYTSNVGTVTSVNNVSPVNGNVTISIPSEVTESTVSGWGFTKNTGTVISVNNVSPVNGNVSLSIPTIEEYTASEVETLWNSISPSA